MPYNPKTDLSSRFVARFWFVAAFFFWLIFNWMLFSDYTVPDPTEPGVVLTERQRINFMASGVQTNDDFPYWQRATLSLFIFVLLVLYGIRFVAEMWLVDRVTEKTRKLIDKI
jgi:hypothetical protein